MYSVRPDRLCTWSLLGLALIAAWLATQATPIALATALTAAEPAEASALESTQQDDQVRRRGAKGDSTAKPKEPSDDGAQAAPREQPRAVPREAPRSKPSAPPPRSGPNRSEPPHRYFAVPRAYFFPPVDLRAGFYYHPYFGFYYGPYYGPFYPHPGPYVHRARYNVGALRLRIRPDEAQVYVNGYYAGIVDDFDGTFQRLHVPAGEHHLDFRLEGYVNFEQHVYVTAGDTLDIRHQMERLPPGRSTAPPPRPRSVPDAWMAPDLEGEGEAPATPFGVLAIRSDPIDAQIVIDGEAWAAAPGQRELVVHLPAGWHRIEVRKDAFRTFSTNVELSEGHTTRLSVTLER